MKLPIGTYSFYNQLENCPHQAFHVYVAKSVPWVSTPEKEWGNTVHKAMENRIKHGSPLPDGLEDCERVAESFHALSKLVPVQAELSLAMTAQGTPCDYEDKTSGWFRGKIDTAVFNTPKTHAWIVDWKTGNVREEPFELECGALLLKVHYPQLETVTVQYYWMKTAQEGLRYTIREHANTFDRLHRLRSEAEGYLNASYGTNGLSWPKRKSPLCDWCAVKSCENYTGKKVKA